MAVSNNALFRIRPGGNDLNGGGCDCSISPAATGSNGSFAGTTFTDTVAAAFTSGMVGSALAVYGIGQYLITGFINASNVTLGSGAPPPLAQGANWAVSAGQDYSQQNAAQASGSAGTATGTATFVDATANAFTVAMVGNILQIASGSGFTAGWYAVIGFTNSSTVTLDRSPGTGTAAVWKLGGGFATLTMIGTAGPTNNSARSFPQINFYLLGSGVPNPASYTYDYTISTQILVDNPQVFNDPATPGYKYAPDVTGGMPVIKSAASSSASLNVNAGFNPMFQGVWFVEKTGASWGSDFLCQASSAGTTGAGAYFYGCVYDQFGQDVPLVNAGGSNSGTAQGNIYFIGGEIFSSVAPSGNVPFAALYIFSQQYVLTVQGSNIHDVVSNGIQTSGVAGASAGSQTLVVLDTIIAKCNGHGIRQNSYNPQIVKNCTIDANLGSGIYVDNNQGNIYDVLYDSNVITNHTQAGTYGINVAGQSLSPDQFGIPLIDFNSYFGNTQDLFALPYGPHDTKLSQSPYVNQAIEDYTLS